jgi:hypothetical protein
MIIEFPDKNYPHIVVEFDTATGLGVYRYPAGGRFASLLSQEDWARRLLTWEIELPSDPDLVMDVGL